MDTNGEHRHDKSADADAFLFDASLIAEARLTAYVLGELDAGERLVVEKDLVESESARQQVAEIRRSVETVTAALAAEAVAELPRIGRELLIRNKELRGPCQSSRERIFSRHTIATRYFLAASILLCFVGATGWMVRSAVKQRAQGIPVAVRIERIVGESEAPSPAARLPKVEEKRGRFGLYETKTRSAAYSSNKTAHGDATDSPHQYPATLAPDDVASAADKYNTAGEGRTGATDFAIDNNRSMDQVRRPRASLVVEMYDIADGTKLSPSGPRIIIQEEEAPLQGFREAGEFNTESYDRIYENPFLDVRQNPLSTFSIDVDTASYAYVRRFLNAGSLPPKDAVRIEEMVNYFTYHYAPPADDKPFAVHAEVAGCPWEPKHRLLRIALKGREIDLENRPASNLVFLLDVSGSMDEPAKLPLLKSALHLLIDKLAENDRVAMVVYAGSSGLVLPSTSGLYKETIQAALDQLQAGGSTNGGSGIQLAYKVAREKFVKGGTNRVILCTDGDFNVGITDQGSLTRLIEDEAKSGVFLSVLGFGAGNLKDSTMEKLADRGNGNYAYIDTINEARKVLVEQLGGTLLTIAKDVKLQIEFNPRQVAAYRLIGYENRLLRAEDFSDDKKDAGEIGAGHTVTAFYELVPAGGDVSGAKVDELKYQRPAEPADAAADELLTLKLRYKQPDGDQSKLIETVVKDGDAPYAKASEDFRFATAAAGFGLLLRDSQYKGDLTFAAVQELAQASRGSDHNGYRAEFVALVKKAQAVGR